jgi:site-specific DNA-methyltransferase (adenine-specific)
MPPIAAPSLFDREELNRTARRQLRPCSAMLAVGDAVEWARAYDGEPFHALLCDPPYHLDSIVKRFGKEGSAPAKGGVYGRSSRGFMGLNWDGGDVAFRPETWESFKNVLYPGAFGVAFASARGYHRMATAIEDAGFIIHHMLGWLYASGFHHATRIDTQLEKNVGEGMAAWQGHRYGLQTIKPAMEPICLFQKPYAPKVPTWKQITESGAGALNIEGTRVGESGGGVHTRSQEAADSQKVYGKYGPIEKNGEDTGRWPSNVLLTHSEGCDARGCVEGCAVDALGREARFFEATDLKLEQSDPFLFSPKPARREKEAGLEEMADRTKHRVNAGGLENEPRFAPIQVKNDHPCLKGIALCQWLATLLLPPDHINPRRILVPFAGSGSEMIGAGRAGWDIVNGVELLPEYAEIANARLSHWLGV